MYVSPLLPLSFYHAPPAVVNFAAMDRISATASETQGATEDERALVAMGHALSDARAATSASPDLQKAAWRLFCGLCGVDPAPGGVEGWEEEREALEAIYGDEASVSPSDAPPSLKMAWKLPAGGPWGAGATAEVEVEVPPGCSYPACPPAVLVRVQGGTIPPTTARKVLEGVAGRLGPLVGSPMFFEAASGAREELEREDHWVAGGGRLEDREPKAAEEAPSVAGETTADTVVLDSMEDMAAELSDEERGEEEGKRGGAGGARRREVRGQRGG